MGRGPSIAIDKNELQAVVNKLENPSGSVEQGKGKKGKKTTETTPIVSPYTTRSALFAAIAASEWGQQQAAKGGKMNPQNIYNWVNKYGIQMITPVGKKGRQKGQKVEGGGRKKKGFNQAFYDKLIKDLERHGERANTKSNRNLAKLAASGNRTAAVKLKCKECNGYESKVNTLIQDCNSVACPLWGIRPYQEVVQIAPMTVVKPADEVEPVAA